jgi:ubiquinone biosynthesis monooxygenase Coq7
MHDQIDWLAGRDGEARAVVAEIMAEELQHLDFAERHAPAGGDRLALLLDGLVAVATDVVIWLSTYGASAEMARDLKRD